MVLRHGLPGCLLAVICFGLPNLQPAFWDGLEKGFAKPTFFLTYGFFVFCVLNGHAWWKGRRWDVLKLTWIVYLGALSFWEEWVFRVAPPVLLESGGATVLAAAIISAILFGGVHYFTLRWKWYWCVGAGVGGFALSQQMQLHQDLLMIACIHWVATYLNTPRPPGYSARLEIAPPDPG